jgi:hypothetical protein
MDRPRCQYKGALPHPAKPAYVLIWELPTHTVAKWSCAEHRFKFGGRGHWITKVEGFWEDDAKPADDEVIEP